MPSITGTTDTGEKERITRSLRYRVNVSTSVKGIKTWDVTCDGQGYTMEEILDRSDAIVTELDRRYPPPDTQ
tara:strand:- start:2182 stop:2397 length:216 start_codon:yes stop_codon:yes gene_type:complete